VGFATSSAEGFATGAAYILAKTGIVDSLCFGAETANMAGLKEIAHYLAHETGDYKRALKEGVAKGLSFPRARAAALSLKFPNANEVINSPNNILATEYLKAIKRHSLPLEPFLVQRTGADHHGQALTGAFASASALRAQIHAGNIDVLAPFMPPESLELLKSEHAAGRINHLDNLSPFLHYLLMNSENSPLKKAAKNNYLITDIIKEAKTKNITLASLRRKALHTILRPAPPALPAYIRVLGFNREKSHLISKLHTSSALPLITNAKHAKELLAEEIKTTKFYWLSLKHKNIDEKNELSTPIVLV
ncbi:MAG: nucleotidyltransferase family protein, partial [Defluviitaleaceae bacterium]|nr:nucleotidyltransferase family protein [Defluviitaleaceae bacterium]